MSAYAIVLELRNGLAAACRIIAKHNLADEFLAEARAADVQDGVGVRADQFLREARSAMGDK